MSLAFGTIGTDRFGGQMTNTRVASVLLRGAVGSLVASIVIAGILLLPDTGSTLTERLSLDQSEIIALGE